MARNSAPSTDKVARSGSLTVFIDFNGGQNAGVTIDTIHDAVRKVVTDLTGASDVRVLNRGAALVLDSSVDIMPSPAMRAALSGATL